MKEEKYIVDCDIKILDYFINIKKEISKKKIKQYLKYNNILVNGEVVSKTDYMLNKNDVVIIKYGRKVMDYDIDIIYEDKDIIVINKPSGLLSISNSKENEATAFRMVRDYVRKNNPKVFLFVIHRLDKDTSGILMFAKSEKIKHLFQDNWNDIVLKRKYMAVVDGYVKDDKGRIESYLKENKIGKIYSSRNKEGKYAITEYKVIKKSKNKTLLDINILTGRRNQIRVHLSEMGNPIIGDKKYGSRSNSRLMLHAYELELMDPRNNKKIKFSTDIPNEFNNL